MTHPTRETLSRDQSWSQKRGQAVLISLHSRSPMPIGEKTLQWRVFRRRRPLRQRNGRNDAGLRVNSPCLWNSSSSLSFRGLSSAGRAPDLHSGGHRFDPDRLHQIPSGFGVAHRLFGTDDLPSQIERLHQRVVGKAQNTQKLGSVAQLVRAHA